MPDMQAVLPNIKRAIHRNRNVLIWLLSYTNCDGAGCREGLEGSKGGTSS